MYSVVILCSLYVSGIESNKNCFGQYGTEDESCQESSVVDSTFSDDLDFEREIILSKALEEAIEKSKDIQELEEIYRHNLNNLHNKNSYRRHSSVAKALSDTAEILEVATRKVERAQDQRRVRRAAALGLRRPYSPKSQSFARRKVSAAVADSSLTELMMRCHLNESNSCQAGSSPSQYRSYSGACNNLQLPSLGASLTEQGRLLPAQYSDGISKPRSYSVLKRSPLPNPRAVSSSILERLEELDPRYNLMVMQWGQFIDHDFAMTPQYKGPNNSPIDCSSCDSPRHHRGCFPILVPQADNFYPRTGGRRCMKFLRSLPGQQRLGPREQLNAVSHWLDGSMVYGSDPCMAAKLRAPAPLSHLLVMTDNSPRKDLLPLTRDNPECEAADKKCFMAGDERVNEHPGLSMIHTMVAREHNRIAAQLRTINNHWDQEKVFQETRRIVVALIQHITYSEFLPRVLGPVLMTDFSLSLLPEGHTAPSHYDQHCEAVILNEFAGAAFRFGHSLIRANLSLMGESGQEEEVVALRKVFHDPTMIRSGNLIDSLVLGLVMSSMETMDRKLSEEVANHLFEEKGKAFSGLDLGALNIQRGRDHGLAGYNKYRELCGLNRADTFTDLQEISPVWADNLAKLYPHPDDVDLFVGMLLEKKVEGGIVGPTLGCLLGTQFRTLKHCDRFWYETGDLNLKFTAEQLAEIRGSSLSALLCRNCDNPASLPNSGLDAMKPSSNPMVHCEEMNHLNLDIWRDQSSQSDL